MIKYSQQKYGRILMYYGVISRLVCEKHNIKNKELEMLLFLYGHGIFKRKDFIEFRKGMPFTVTTFDGLVKKGWVYIFAYETKTAKGNRKLKPGSHTAIYDLSAQCKSIITYMYKQIFGEIAITEQYNTSRYKENIEIRNKKNKILVHKKAIASGLVKNANGQWKKLRESSDKEWLAKIAKEREDKQ